MKKSTDNDNDSRNCLFLIGTFSALYQRQYLYYNLCGMDGDNIADDIAMLD